MSHSNTSESSKTRLTTSSPGLKMSCCSSCSKLKRFSDLPDSALTLARKSRTMLMTFGSCDLSGLSSGVCLRTASRRRGYRARRVVGFVRYAFSSNFRDSGNRSVCYNASHHQYTSSLHTTKSKSNAPQQRPQTPDSSSSPSQTRTSPTADARRSSQTAGNGPHYPTRYHQSSPQ